jgi:hypothetical protein
LTQGSKCPLTYLRKQGGLSIKTADTLVPCRDGDIDVKSDKKGGKYMNEKWSDLNKTMQLQIKKKETFPLGIDTLLVLRKELLKQAFEMKDILTDDEFCAIPFINANGYHNKTIAYSLYHVFRIEDIVTSTLIKKQEQIFFVNDYKKRMRSTIVTTGNELQKQEIADFSSKLDIDEMYNYILDVNGSTTQLLLNLTYQDLKMKITEDDKKNLLLTNAVNKDENALWLIDYWCGKNLQGLIQMPFSRHWIMHIEASLRIKNKIYSGIEA